MSTLRQLLSWGSETLEKAEVPDSGQDAWMLMEEVFGIEKSYYFLHGTDKIDPDVQKRYEEMIRDPSSIPSSANIGSCSRTSGISPSSSFVAIYGGFDTITS